MKSARMVIGGELVDAVDGARFDAINPFTGETWATVPDAGAADVDRAVGAARRAFDDGWGRTTGLRRATLMHALADLLEQRADEFALMETTDNGKVIRETRAQMSFAARNLRFFAGYADKLYGRTIPMDNPRVFDYTVRVPYGVVAIITAWNSPISLLHNKLPAALASGNTVVIKPSEHASVTTLEYARLALEAGFPPGVVNVITGAGVAGNTLTSHPGVDRISFTGGSGTGRAVALNAARSGIPVTLELGGKSPNIIFEDADLPAAVTGAVSGIFAAAGQTCIAGSRLLVHDSLYDEVVERIVRRAEGIALGDPRLPETEMGPVANRPQFDRILSMIGDARSSGADIATGGVAPTVEGGEKGLFIAPTVVVDVQPDMAIAQEEVFGPVLSVLRFGSDDEAFRIANDSPYGLAAGLWTRDLSRTMRAVEALDAGVVWVNTYRVSAAQAPFGGTKQSGHGRERGEDALAEYSWIKNVMIDFSGEARDPFVVRT
jgi:(Z)-2-((N-methylformamido)methylene)-5-hydroxybutyrolactone dehydrogenase